MLRAYRPWLDGVPRALRRRLRDLARATGEGRDAEVFLDWLAQRPAGAAPAAWMQPYLERRRDRAYRHIRGGVLRDFAKLAGRLRRALESIRAERGPAGPEGSFAAATAGRLREYAEKLASDVARIRDFADVATIHAARIQAKRVRYLLEPLVAVPLAGSAPAVRALRAFQDESGLLCDGYARRALLSEAARAAGEEILRRGLRTEAQPFRADPHAELIQLARASEADARARYAALARCYLGARASRFERALGAGARRLALAAPRA